jgi:hypothetical protein
MPRFQQDSLGRFVRADGTPAPPPDKSVKQRRGPQQFKHFKVDEVLSPEHRAEYEQLLASPTTTVKQLRSWLRERGHRVCRSAVARHRRSFAEDSDWASR